MQSSRSELYLNKNNYLVENSPSSLMVQNDIMANEACSDYALFDGTNTEVSMVTGVEYGQETEPDTDPTSVVLKGKDFESALCS